jgi:hypothetical protein
MNIGVFFHDYQPMHEAKDPGQIVLGFEDIGVKVELVTLEKPVLNNYSNLPIRLISAAQAHGENFWASTEYDAVIAYTWLREDFLWMPETLKRAGKRVVVKADTDGRIAFPLHPRWDCFSGKALGVLPTLKVLRRRLNRQLGGAKGSAGLIRHLNVADIAVVETPQAFSNLAYILGYWKRAELLGKFIIMPNPVAPDVLEAEFKQKKDQIVAVGNWETRFGDYRVKNTEVMCKVVTEFLSLNPRYRAVIMGEGEEILKKLFARTHLGTLSRIWITGQIPHRDVVKHISASRIIFAPSISESFGIAASEAVCLGCSIVGSPLESFQYLTCSGFSGTLAATFDKEAYLGALIADAIRWDRGDYSPERVAAFWREQLDRKEIARKYARMFDRLLFS